MFNIVIKETKAFVREKAYLFFFLLFPVILVFLLGNLLQSLDASDEPVGEIKVQYIVDTQDPYQMAAIDNFISAISSKKIIFTKTDHIEVAKALAKEDKITAAVLFTGKPLEIITFEGTDDIKNRTVEAILEGFIQTDKVVTTVLRTAPQSLITEEEGKEFATEKNFGFSRSMIDYYAVSMTVMIAFMSMITGSSAFMSEREDKTINRLIIAPQNRVSMFLQKVLGMLPQTLLQVVVIMGISMIIFDAHYGADYKAVLFLFLMFCIITFCMISLGAILGLVMKKISPFVLIMPVIWIMLFLGGTYSKELFIKGVTDIMPNYFFQQAAYELSVFGEYDGAIKVCMICLMITLIALAIGAVLFCRKEEER